MVVFGALAIRVTQLQVLSGNRYRLMSLQQTQKTLTLQPERGTIFDRAGRDLAMSIQTSAVYVDPRQPLDPIAYAAVLAPVLNMNENRLRGLLVHRRFEFGYGQYLAHDVSDSVVAKVRSLNLAGIGFVPDSQRQYPAGALAGSIIGAVGSDGVGRFGLEYLYNSLLQGRSGKIDVQRDPQGLAISSQQLEGQRGSDVMLTLDEPLQWETEQSLIDEVSATRAKGGMAVVVDVTNGDVVAMASIEGASGNTPAHPSGPTEATRPLMDLFEPGSTNKLITLSTAIEDGLVQPNTLIDVPSALMVGGTQFTDVDPHGDVQMTVADILRQSSNIGTIKIAQRLTPVQLDRALRRFGLGRETNVQFFGQAKGILHDPAHYYSTGLASTAIGYGVSVTGMQMLDAYVTIANGGVSRPPHLLDATIDAKGHRHVALIAPGRRVVSSRTAGEMSSMLASVVSSGTGACAAIPGYTVAGKTGTAHIAVGGGYSQATMASFIGYAPAAHPKLATIVVLDEPTSTYGGAAAAPVFADVMQFALSHYAVPPDDPSNSQYNSARASAATTGTACVDPAVAAAAEHASAGTAASGTNTGTTTTTIGATTSTPATAAAKSTAKSGGVPTSTGARSTTGTNSGSKKRPPPAGGGAATPGSLPVNTSQSG